MHLEASASALLQLWAQGGGGLCAGTALHGGRWLLFVVVVSQMLHSPLLGGSIWDPNPVFAN